VVCHQFRNYKNNFAATNSQVTEAIVSLASKVQINHIFTIVFIGHPSTSRLDRVHSHHQMHHQIDGGPVEETASKHAQSYLF
jgi:hypothetical protein